MPFRSISAQLKNRTNFSLILVNAAVVHGIFDMYHYPPARILSGEDGWWISKGTLTGTEFRIRYKIDMGDYSNENEDNFVYIDLHLDNQYPGNSSFSYNISGLKADNFAFRGPGDISGADAKFVMEVIEVKKF